MQPTGLFYSALSLVLLQVQNMARLSAKKILILNNLRFAPEVSKYASAEIKHAVMF
jgi:hypothetical protein